MTSSDKDARLPICSYLLLMEAMCACLNSLAWVFKCMFAFLQVWVARLDLAGKCYELPCTAASTLGHTVLFSKNWIIANPVNIFAELGNFRPQSFLCIWDRPKQGLF